VSTFCGRVLKHGSDGFEEVGARAIIWQLR